MIAIIGCPNVGKSTLFNRLVKARKALVNPMAGLTRDLHEDIAQIGQRQVRLTDSAGLDLSPEELKAKMTRKALSVVEDADIVLFIIDGKNGLTSADEEWARQLRPLARQIILVANKCENEKKAHANLIDAYQLGLGDPIAISAEHNLGLADLDERVIKLLPQSDVSDIPEREDKALKMAIIGRPNVGKSSLVNFLLGEERQLTGEEPGMTRDAISFLWRWKSHPIELFDTAGLRRRARIFSATDRLASAHALRAIRFADIVVLMMDIRHCFESQDIRLAHLIIREGRVPIFAINKTDLALEKNPHDIKKKARFLLNRFDFDIQNVPIVSFSIKESKNVKTLMPKVIRAYQIWHKEISTAQLNGWLKKSVLHHPPPSSGRKIVKMKYITQKSTRPPSFVVFTNHPKYISDDYKRYLINDIRQSFGFEGVPIRLEIRTSTNPYASS